MTLHGARAEEKPFRDLGIGQALAQQAEDLLLARRQAACCRGSRGTRGDGRDFSGCYRQIDGQCIADRSLDGDAATSAPLRGRRRGIRQRWNGCRSKGDDRCSQRAKSAERFVGTLPGFGKPKKRVDTAR